MIGFEITANAFLRHMVRGIVGTLIEVGRGRLEPAQFQTVLEAGDRRRAGPNAPPHGLIFTGVEYPEEFEVTSAQLGQSQERYQGYPGPDLGLGDRSGGRSAVLSDMIGSRRATGVS